MSKVEKTAWAAPPDTSVPRAYIGPMPAPTISNLPCKCSKPADQLDREQQDYVIATVPEAATWFA